MERVTGKCDARFMVFHKAGMPLLCVILFLAESVAQPQEPAKSQPTPSNGGVQDNQAAKGREPLDVYRRYLTAIKANDLAGAKSCWRVSGNDTSGALDVI